MTIADKVDKEIIEAVKPILDRYVKEHPESTKPGFFIGFFVGIGVDAGISDGLSDSVILEEVRKQALAALSERR